MVNNRVITNKLDRLERALKKKLVIFYNSKIKGSPIPVDILKQKYDQQLKDLIRKTAQESYLIGTDTVGNQVLTKDPDFQLFISATDLTNIAQLTERLSNDFWNTAQQIQDREQAVTAEGKPRQPFDSLARLTGIAAGLVFSAFNNAIKSKATQISIPTLAVPPTDQGLIVPLDVGFEIRPVGRVRFVTKQDGKVDPDICQPLHNTVWFVDSPDIIIPPDMTHKFCRCVLEPVLD